METANATRPKFGEWYLMGDTVVHDVLVGHRLVHVAASRDWLATCANACASIRNPSAIPALIEAARRVANADVFGTRELSREVRDALAALYAEPVA